MVLFSFWHWILRAMEPFICSAQGFPVLKAIILAGSDRGVDPLVPQGPDPDCWSWQFKGLKMLVTTRLSKDSATHKTHLYLNRKSQGHTCIGKSKGEYQAPWQVGKVHLCTVKSFCSLPPCGISGCGWSWSLSLHTIFSSLSNNKPSKKASGEGRGKVSIWVLYFHLIFSYPQKVTLGTFPTVLLVYFPSTVSTQIYNFSFSWFVNGSVTRDKKHSDY